MAAKRLNPSQLDDLAKELEAIEFQADELRARLKQQIEDHGFIPPRADKSRRLMGEEYKFTLSTSISTEINDAEVVRIQQLCEPDFFARLFRPETKWRLVNGGMALLTHALPKGSPSRLRQMFARAVVLRESTPRLRIEKVNETVEV